MKKIELYILKQVLSAFMVCLFALIAIIWLTQALKEFDIMTSQGQTLLLFAHFTALILPSLVVIIAPIAAFIACLFTLNRMNRDSELVILSASGASKLLILKPFALIAISLTALMFALSLVIVPNSFREMRHIITQVRADFITTLVKPGRFADIEKGLTFHVRARDAQGVLQDIMLHDSRNPDEVTTYFARAGKIAEASSGSYLVMENGVIQRTAPQTGQVIVSFDRYVFDLSQFIQNAEVTFYKPKERTLAELISPDAKDAYAERFPDKLRAELLERFSAPLYGLSFVFVALAFLGDAVSTRQKKTMRIVASIFIVVAIRGLGFMFTSLAGKTPSLTFLVFLLPLASAAFFIYLSFGHGRRMNRWLNVVSQKVSPLFSPLERFVGGLRQRVLKMRGA